MGESYLVIPGRIKDANLRCAIAHRGISRLRVRCGACHRAAPCADPLASPRNDYQKTPAFAGGVKRSQGAATRRAEETENSLKQRVDVVLRGVTGVAVQLRP